MAALATISSGLSCGRLLGPPLAALMLSVSPVAPLWLMAIAPLIALLLVLREVADPPLPPVAHQATRLQASMLPFLLLALLLAALVSLMQLGLSPHLSPRGWCLRPRRGLFSVRGWRREWRRWRR